MEHLIINLIIMYLQQLNQTIQLSRYYLSYKTIKNNFKFIKKLTEIYLLIQARGDLCSLNIEMMPK